MATGARVIQRVHAVLEDEESGVKESEVEEGDAKSASRAPRQLSNEEICEYLRQVESTISWCVREFGRGLSREDQEDLAAAGREGALEAMGRFEPERGYRFSTYAAFRVRDHVVRQAFFFWGRGRMSEGSTSRRVLFHRRRVEREVESRGEVPTVERVAKELSVTPELLTCAMAMTADDQDLEGLENEDVSALAAFDRVLDGADFERVREAVREHLDQRERFIVLRRYEDGWVQHDVAEALGLTVARVSQLEDRALAKLRKVLTE